MTVKTFIERMEELAVGANNRTTLLTANQYRELFMCKAWPPQKAYTAVNVAEIREAIQQYRAARVAQTLTK